MIPNTFCGFGSMTVRNTNIVTMSSFVLHVPRKTIGRKQEHDHLCNYEKNFKHWIVNISFIFNILRDFSSGSVWELYLLSVMILIALFCNLMSLCVLKPHSKMLLLKCGAISELYMIFRVYFGRKCFRCEHSCHMMCHKGTRRTRGSSGAVIRRRHSDMP